MAGLIKRFFSFLAFIENVICTAGLLGTTFMITFQILNRFWLRLDIKWINDLSLFIFIFFCFFAIVLTAREDGHTSVDMLVDFLFGKKPALRAAYVLCTRILCAVVIGFFLIPAYSFALDAYKYPQPGNLVQWFNESWLMESLFVTMILSLLHILYNVVKGFGEVLRMAKNEEKGR